MVMHALDGGTFCPVISWTVLGWPSKHSPSSPWRKESGHVVAGKKVGHREGVCVQ